MRSIPLPVGVDATRGPLTTGVGEIYRYRIEAPGLSLVEQRALQDWGIEPHLRRVQGVADVVAFGGGVKQYQVQVDPGRLKDYRLTIQDVYDAVAGSNANTGGGHIEHGYEALVGGGWVSSARPGTSRPS